MKILDCTLRDGGYYTNWDFSPSTVEAYIQAMNDLPVDYLELGYRNKPSKEYLGKFGYSPVEIVRGLRSMSTKKLALMLNEKSVLPEDLDVLIRPVIGLVDMIRLAVDPKNFDRAVVLAKAVKGMGLEVGFNVMYMSKWAKDDVFLKKLVGLELGADLLCMVDSYGGVTPDEVTETIDKIRTQTCVPLGFHGHNNLQLGLINTLTAIKKNVDYVDATVLGMGRGAGNLKLELLLTYLNRHAALEVDFNVLGDVVSTFEALRQKYHWGTNLPYMLSGANNIPQKDVMDWVSNRVYSFNSIVRALDNRRNNKKDNAMFPILKVGKKYGRVVVVGGGPSAAEHAEAIREYLALNPASAIVFATARHADKYVGLKNDCFYCLVGNEGCRLMTTVGERAVSGVCVLPPYPRMMGTEVPKCVAERTYELDAICFVDSYKDSVTTVALQLAQTLTEGDVYVVGYDGYPGSVLSEKEIALSHENQTIFQAFNQNGKVLKSLTPTLYPDLSVESVYQYI